MGCNTESWGSRGDTSLLAPFLLTEVRVPAALDPSQLGEFSSSSLRISVCSQRDVAFSSSLLLLLSPQLEQGSTQRDAGDSGPFVKELVFSRTGICHGVKSGLEQAGDHPHSRLHSSTKPVKPSWLLAVTRAWLFLAAL